MRCRGVACVEHRDQANRVVHASSSQVSGPLKVVTYAVQDAIPGTRTHGTITGATPTGVFVSFFNGIRGLVHASALGLAEDQTPEDAFKVGQVWKPESILCVRGPTASLITVNGQERVHASATGA